MDDKPQRKVDEQMLKRLGFSEAAIQEAKERERKGLLDIEPQPSLVERTIAECNRAITEQEHRRKMEENFLYRTFYSLYDRVRSLYK